MVSFVRLSSDWALRVESVRKVDNCGWYALGKLIFLNGNVCVCGVGATLSQSQARGIEIATWSTPLVVVTLGQ
jgi:hypothetical protein